MLGLKNHVSHNLENRAVLSLDDFILLVHNNPHNNKKQQVLIILGYEILPEEIGHPHRELARKQRHQPAQCVDLRLDVIDRQIP